MSQQSGQAEQSDSKSKSLFYQIGNRCDKKQPKNVVGADIRIYRPHISQKLRAFDGPSIEGMDAHTIYHIKGDVVWALGPKAKHEIMRDQWGRERKDINLQELLKLFKKTFMPARDVFHSRAQFFNVKQEDGETLDDYWKRLVDIER